MGNWLEEKVFFNWGPVELHTVFWEFSEGFTSKWSTAVFPDPGKKTEDGLTACTAGQKPEELVHKEILSKKISMKEVHDVKNLRCEKYSVLRNIKWVCVCIFGFCSSIALLQITAETERCSGLLRGGHWGQRSSRAVDLSAHCGLRLQRLFKATTPSSFFFLLLWQQKYPRTILIVYLPQQLWTGFQLLVVRSTQSKWLFLDHCVIYHLLCSGISILGAPCVCFKEE